MKRLTRLFAQLRKKHRCGLIAYVTCGDPDASTTVETVLALARAGADAIELGVPFSDPIADGPVIQAAAQRALERGTTTDELFYIAERIREQSDVPLIAFSYLNPIVRFGVDLFTRRCRESGIDAILVTDLPPESSDELRDAAHREGLGLVALLAPTSPPDRAKLVDRRSDGFVYYVSTTGVTGARRELDPELIGRLDDLRKSLKKPIAVGFGVSTHEHYLALVPHCDAVVVGSAIVRAMSSGGAAGAAERAANVVREILEGNGTGS